MPSEPRLRLSSLIIVTIVLAPVVATGWPMLHPEPLTFVGSCSMGYLSLVEVNPWSRTPHISSAASPPALSSSSPAMVRPNVLR